MHDSKNLTVRAAIQSDLDALTWIGIAAFPFEPQWNYRYPYAGKFPEDHYVFTKLRYREWLDVAKTPECIIMVVESPSLDDPEVTKVVGLSIWRMPQHGDEKLKPPKTNPHRRDANPAHMAAYRMSVVFTQERYFDCKYGKNQLSLAQLATHPDYFKRGAATMLLEWGVAHGQENNLPITVFAGPMAYNLYGRFGFKTLVGVTTHVLDETESIEFPGMVWEPEGYVKEKGGREDIFINQVLAVYDLPDRGIDSAKI